MTVKFGRAVARRDHLHGVCPPSVCGRRLDRVDPSAQLLQATRSPRDASLSGLTRSPWSSRVRPAPPRHDEHGAASSRVSPPVAVEGAGPAEETAALRARAGIVGGGSGATPGGGDWGTGTTSPCGSPQPRRVSPTRLRHDDSREDRGARGGLAEPGRVSPSPTDGSQHTNGTSGIVGWVGGVGGDAAIKSISIASYSSSLLEKRLKTDSPSSPATTDRVPPRSRLPELLPRKAPCSSREARGRCPRQRWRGAHREARRLSLQSFRRPLGCRITS